MTESIKFGPEWLRNSVANVVAAPANQQQQQHQQPQSPSTDSIISRPVLSDHRYGREEMLSLCDKTVRLPDALPRFRRLFVADWQMPLALQPNTDDEQIGTRGLGGTGTPPWGTHIRPLMPAMSRGAIRGGAIERGRGRGRGLYHGTSYTRSTSLYDEEGRRWLDRNGTEGTTEWSAGSAVSPRKEGFSRSALESWRKGTRDENEEGWRSSSNGTNNAAGPPVREKWTRSTSWRDGTDNSITSDAERANGTSQLMNSASPTSGVNSGGGSNPSMRAPVGYKKSWDEDSNLPEWATESFDYGGTFDASGAFHDSERTGSHDDDRLAQRGQQQKLKQKQQQQQQQNHVDAIDHEDVLEVEQQTPPTQTKLMMDFLNEESPPPTVPKEKQQHIDLPNGPSIVAAAAPPAPIAQMDKMVENFVAHLIMDDDATSGSNVKQPPPPLIEWFYRDPQGDTQGPFSSSDMSEWYKAGYFQESLMVRRSIDNTFVPLGQLVKVFGALRPFIAASIDGGQPIPQPPQPEPIDQFRLQRMMNQQQQQQPPPQPPQQQQQPPQPAQQQPQQPPPQQQQPPAPDVNNWSMMTAEQRMFLMQLAHQRQPPPPQQQQQPQVDSYGMKMPSQQPQQPPQSTPLDMRRMMGANDFFQSPAPPVVQQQPQPPPVSQMEPDPLQQLIMQIQMQQKTGGPDAAQQWIKSSQPQQQQQQPNVVMMQGNGPMDLNAAALHSGMPQGGGQPWNATPLPMWDISNSNNIHKDQNQQSLQQQQQELHQQHPPEPDIIQNGVMDSESHQQHLHAQMQKVESKKKKKEAAAKEQLQQQQQQSLQMVKDQQQKKQQQQLLKEANDKKKSNEKQKKEERSTQPAAPAPWVGLQANVSGTSLSKIQKTEAQRRQVEMAAQKEREQHQKLEIMAKMTEVRDVKWNLQMPPAAHVKSLDEIQAEEQTAAEREAAIAKREKKETVTIVADIWSTGAHSMAWQQPKAWSGSNSGGQSNSGFWEDPVKQAPQPKQPQLLSKSQTMATITTAKKQQQLQQQQQMQQHMQQQQQKKIERKVVKNDKKKEEVNNEFTQWCTRTLSAMNGNVDVPTFVSFLQDIESPFEIKDYIKMYLGETKECTEFAKQFLERRSKQRNQQRLQNAHIDDMCSPAPAINPQANNSGDFQEVKGKNKKVKAKKVMKAVDNRILGFTATSAPDRINVGDRDYGDA